MAGEMAPPVPPPAYQSSRQLPLPLPLGPPLRRASAPEQVGPQHVWPRLGPAARARVRQAFARVLREVLHDGAGAQR